MRRLYEAEQVAERAAEQAPKPVRRNRIEDFNIERIEGGVRNSIGSIEAMDSGGKVRFTPKTFVLDRHELLLMESLLTGARIALENTTEFGTELEDALCVAFGILEDKIE